MKKIITAACLVLGLAMSAWAQCSGSCNLFPPGLRYPLIDWRFVNGGNLPQTHAVFMKEDTITIKVESGGRLSLGPDEMEIVLTSSVNWKKELTAFSFCNGRGTTIWTHDSRRGPVSMRLRRSSCNGDTVVLRKEKFLQGMVDMYHLDPFRFWNLWAGKIITINWNSDFDFGSFPPVCNFPCVPTITRSDAGILYDTDGKADIAVFREGSNGGEWFVVNTSTGISFSKPLGRFGDRPLPYDYDGDGRTDMAVWRRDTGEWIIINSLTGQTRVVPWGVSGTMPAPGDYDGDGKADLAVFNPANGTWFIKGYITGVESSRPGGGENDLQVAADYDGDRKTDPAVWTYQTSVWSIFTNPPRTVQWGTSNDRHLPFDFDGDGKADIAVWRDGTWWIKKSASGVDFTASWGTWGDRPVPQDYDGDGKADLAVYRPWTSEWWILRSSDGQQLHPMFGAETDTPVPSK